MCNLFIYLFSQNPFGGSVEPASPFSSHNSFRYQMELWSMLDFPDEMLSLCIPIKKNVAGLWLPENKLCHLVTLCFIYSGFSIHWCLYGWSRTLWLSCPFLPWLLVTKLEPLHYGRECIINIGHVGESVTPATFIFIKRPKKRYLLQKGYLFASNCFICPEVCPSSLHHLPVGWWPL